MKITVELTEDDNFEDMMNGSKYRWVLQELDAYFRNLDKSDKKITPSDARELIYDYLDGLSLYKD